MLNKQQLSIIPDYHYLAKVDGILRSCPRYLMLVSIVSDIHCSMCVFVHCIDVASAMSVQRRTLY